MKLRRWSEEYEVVKRTDECVWMSFWLKDFWLVECCLFLLEAVVTALTFWFKGETSGRTITNHHHWQIHQTSLVCFSFSVHQASQLGVYRAFVDNYEVAVETAEKCCQANTQFAEISEVRREMDNKHEADIILLPCEISQSDTWPPAYQQIIQLSLKNLFFFDVWSNSDSSLHQSSGSAEHLFTDVHQHSHNCCLNTETCRAADLFLPHSLLEYRIH